MTEQNQKTEKIEEKKIVAPVKTEEKKDSTVSPTSDNKTVEKKIVAPKIVKTEATASGVSLHASKRHCMYIGTFIKGKTIDGAIADLEQVMKLKRAIPFKGEIPHRKGAMMSGRYPVSASKLFITMLKGLKGNILVNNMDLQQTRIFSVVSNWATRPRRSSGRAKRTHVTIVAKLIAETKKEEKQSKSKETNK